MGTKTLRYIISLCLLCLPVSLSAQFNMNSSSSSSQQQQSADRNPDGSLKREERPKPAYSYPFYNGVFVGVDLWGPGAKVLGGDNFSTEVGAYVDLKHRFFPGVEIGYGRSDKWSDINIHYKLKGAPYFRVGVEYNTLWKKKHQNMLLVGVRYGFSSFKFDLETPDTTVGTDGQVLTNANFTDDYWGESFTFSKSGMKATMHWVELSAGVRAKIWKELYMGWQIRYRKKISAKTDTNGDPWYVPGFGKYGDSRIGVTYKVLYKFNIGRVKQPVLLEPDKK